MIEIVRFVFFEGRQLPRPDGSTRISFPIRQYVDETQIPAHPFIEVVFPRADFRSRGGNALVHRSKSIVGFEGQMREGRSAGGTAVSPAEYDDELFRQ